MIKLSLSDESIRRLQQQAEKVNIEVETLLNQILSEYLDSEITVSKDQASDDEKKELASSFNAMQEEAEKNGLTQEILEKIIHEKSGA